MPAKLSVFLLTIIMFVPSLQAGSNAEFDAHWHDGKAELNGYRLTVSRYGQERDGTCVLVYVTEPFSKSKLVKVDDPRENPQDTFNALKLNIVRDFQTGIYDYNTMISVFVRSSDFSPAKISFTSAEWCGHVYQELSFGRDRITGHYDSYFENESGPLDIQRVANSIAEDNLFILLRGLRGDYLESGKKRTVQILPSMYFGRLAHESPGWVQAEIKRAKKSKSIKVPAGKFKTMVYELNLSDGRKGVFHIEDHYPHRIIRWQMSPDVKAEMTGSERLKYWSLNRNGNESYLRKLGL
ncbi:MAG: hypothetical protein OEN01_14675 [Candidatus Krumholzibacteria bacterium]|nr:hypothetical protein [Candidatus Krumholzibacteria bacterium]